MALTLGSARQPIQVSRHALGHTLCARAARRQQPPPTGPAALARVPTRAVTISADWPPGTNSSGTAGHAQEPARRPVFTMRVCSMMCGLAETSGSMLSPDASLRIGPGPSWICTWSRRSAASAMPLEHILITMVLTSRPRKASLRWARCRGEVPGGTGVNEIIEALRQVVLHQQYGALSTGKAVSMAWSMASRRTASCPKSTEQGAVGLFAVRCTSGMSRCWRRWHHAKRC